MLHPMTLAGAASLLLLPGVALAQSYPTSLSGCATMYTSGDVASVLEDCRDDLTGSFRLLTAGTDFHCGEYSVCASSLAETSECHLSNTDDGRQTMFGQIETTAGLVTQWRALDRVSSINAADERVVEPAPGTSVENVIRLYSGGIADPTLADPDVELTFVSEVSTLQAGNTWSDTCDDLFASSFDTFATTVTTLNYTPTGTTDVYVLEFTIDYTALTPTTSVIEGGTVTKDGVLKGDFDTHFYDDGSTCFEITDAVTGNLVGSACP